MNIFTIHKFPQALQTSISNSSEALEGRARVLEGKHCLEAKQRAVLQAGEAIHWVL